MTHSFPTAFIRSGHMMSSLFDRFNELQRARRVRQWKASWVAGAQANWSRVPDRANPYRFGSDEEKAWFAGWAWAQRNPDRRRADVIRFAHPRRRKTDTLSRLVRRGTSTAGITALTLIAALWRRRGRSGADR